jgi:hypothetical protein
MRFVGMDDVARQQNEALWAQMVKFWREHDEMEARLTRPVSERILDMAAPLWRQPSSGVVSPWRLRSHPRT